MGSDLAGIGTTTPITIPTSILRHILFCVIAQSMMIFPGLTPTPIRNRPIGRVAYRAGRTVTTSSGTNAAPPLPSGSVVPAVASAVPAPAPAQPAVVKLDKAAGEFCHSEFNFIKVLAETTVFFGLILLRWSAQITKPARVKSLVKAILVLAFLAMHPLYGVVSIFALSAVYTYFQLHMKLKN